MPNHVTNRITATKELIDSLIRVDPDDGKECVDFRLIIPCPAAIVTDSVGMHVKSAAEIALGLIDFRHTGDAHASFLGGDYGAAATVLHVSSCTRQLLEGPHPKDFNDTDWAAFMGYLKAYRECDGLMDWHDWNRAKWGTKWNSYQMKRVSDTVVTFETAWSAPHPVFEKLNADRNECFLHEWADEDTGSNVGSRKYMGQCGMVENELSGTKEGYELAFDLGAASSDNYVLVDGRYEWHDREEESAETVDAVAN